MARPLRRDTAEYIRDSKNLFLADFNDICNLEPACIGIYDLPIGSNIQLVVDADGRRRCSITRPRRRFRSAD